MNLWNMTIACALRWGVASVGVYSTGCGSPYMVKHFRCREYTGGRRSFEAAILRKAGLWLIKIFCKLYVQTCFSMYFIMQESCN